MRDILSDVLASHRQGTRLAAATVVRTWSARVRRCLGYQVTVCDARASLATRRGFPDVDELVVVWAHKYLAATQIDERTAVCVLTRDPKFDAPSPRLGLGTKAGYIGAMGSRRTHQDRLERPREEPMTEQELARRRRSRSPPRSSPGCGVAAANHFPRPAPRSTGSRWQVSPRRDRPNGGRPGDPTGHRRPLPACPATGAGP